MPRRRSFSRRMVRKGTLRKLRRVRRTAVSNAIRRTTRGGGYKYYMNDLLRSSRPYVSQEQKWYKLNSQDTNGPTLNNIKDEECVVTYTGESLHALGGKKRTFIMVKRGPKKQFWKCSGLEKILYDKYIDTDEVIISPNYFDRAT